MSAMYAEMFPVSVRYSGVSIGYALGAILGGAFAPMIAELLLQSTGWSGSVGLYIMALCVVSFVAVTVAGETRGNNLRVAEAHEQYLREHPEETPAGTPGPGAGSVSRRER